MTPAVLVTDTHRTNSSGGRSVRSAPCLTGPSTGTVLPMSDLPSLLRVMPPLNPPAPSPVPAPVTVSSGGACAYSGTLHVACDPPEASAP